MNLPDARTSRPIRVRAQLACVLFTAACSLSDQAMAGSESTMDAKHSHEQATASIDHLFAALAARSESADFQGVREIADQIIALAQRYEGPDSLIEARALISYGGAAFQRRDFAATDRTAERAWAIYQKHLQLNRRLPDTDVRFFLDTVQLLGDSRYLQQRFSEAAVFREALVKFYEHVQGLERWRVLAARARLANALLLAGRYEDGTKHFARAIAEWHQVRDTGTQIPQDVLHFFGSELLRFGYITEAHEVLDRAVQLDEKSATPETADKGRRLALLGRVLRERGDDFGALDVLQRAADILGRTLGEQHPETISARFHLGQTWLKGAAELSQVPNSSPLVLAIARDILWNVSRAYSSLPADRRPAVDFTPIRFQIALTVTETLAGHGDTARALLQPLLDSLHDQSAVEFLTSRFNAESARDLLSLVKILLTERDFSTAEGLADYVRRRLESLGPEHPLLPETLALLGIAHAAQGRESEGLRLILSAVELADRSVDRQLSGLSGRQRFEAIRLLGHVDFLFSLPPHSIDTKLAYRVALGRKNAVFRFAVDERPLKDTDPHVQVLYQDYVGIRRDLARVSRARIMSDAPTGAVMEALNHRAEAVERELTRLSDQFRRARATAGADYSRVCAALGPNTALIEYLAFTRRATGQDEYVAFVLRGDECDRAPLRFDLGPVQPINDAVKELRLGLRAELRALPSVHSVADRAQHLAALIFPRNLRQAVKGVSQLVIAPDLDLATIPFALLPGDNGQEFLMEAYTISYVPSGRDLLRNARAFGSRKAAPSVLAVGNPDFGEPPEDSSSCVTAYDALPGSEREVEAVISRLNAEDSASTKLTGRKASKEHVLREAGRKRILHFATHAFVNGGACKTRPVRKETLSERISEAVRKTIYLSLTEPLTNAGLALQGANTGSADGVLTALDITTLNLDRADLVVLSGCDTGLGEINRGQELVGLRWAFMEAGAKSVVTSLWELPDEPTVTIMATFYDRLVKSGYRPAAALREAQLARLRDDRAHGRSRPWEWATFTIAVSYPEPE